MKTYGKKLLLGLILILFWNVTLFAQARNSIISGEEILQRVRNFVAEQFKELGIRYEMEPASKMDRWIVGQPVDSIRVFYNKEGIPRGYTILSIKAYSRGRVVRSLSYAVKIRVFEKVFVAIKPIPRNVPVTEESVKLVEKEITRLKGNPVTDWSQLKRLIPSRTISRGKILVTNYFRKPYLIQRGKRVTLKYDYQNISIQLKVEALQNGEAGEVIWFKDLRTHKRYKGRVVGEALAVLP